MLVKIDKAFRIKDAEISPQNKIDKQELVEA